MTNRNTPHDAVDLLSEDHRRIGRLFKEFASIRDKRGDDERCVEIIESACAELQIHSMLELDIFYPAVRNAGDGKLEGMINEADVEHDSMDGLIDKLAGLESDDPMYLATFKVLVEYVEQHVKEEEKQIFPIVRKLKNLDLIELGDEMQMRKDELLAQLGEIEEETEDEFEEMERVKEAEYRRPRVTN